MSLQSLPTELIYQVFQYLTHKSIAKFSCSSSILNLYPLSTNEILCLYTEKDPFNKACKQGYPQILKIVNNCDNDCILIASGCNQIKCLEILIKYKINVNYQGFNGMTALHWASYHGKTKCVEILLKNGADPNIQTNGGYTALHWATVKDNIECVQTLLDHGANISILNNTGSTALHLANFNEHTKCAEILEYSAQ